MHDGGFVDRELMDPYRVMETPGNSLGEGKASSVRSLCWALLWGKTTGNSINVVRGKLLSLRWLAISPFDLLMFLKPFGLLPIIPMPESLRLFIPACPGMEDRTMGAT